jgi:hypothetical protein
LCGHGVSDYNRGDDLRNKGAITKIKFKTMKTTKKTVEMSVGRYVVNTEKTEIEVYTCSDGTVFTSENDGLGSYQAGKEQARVHENRYQVLLKAKEELKYKLIVGHERGDNCDYDREFCFYYREDLSKATKDSMHMLVHDSNDNLKDATEGWYIVNQIVYEIDTCSNVCDYGCDGFVMRLDEYVEQLGAEYTKYLGIYNELKDGE